MNDDLLKDFDVRISVGEKSVNDLSETEPMERSGLIADKQKTLKQSAKLTASRQRQLDLGDGVYQAPPLDLLAPRDINATVTQLNKDALQQNAGCLHSVCSRRRSGARHFTRWVYQSVFEHCEV